MVAQFGTMLAIAALTSVLCPLVAIADEEKRDQPHATFTARSGMSGVDWERHFPQRRSHFPGRPSMSREFYSAGGYVFLNGKYIEPPYTIAVREGVFHVNGQPTRVQGVQAPPGNAGQHVGVSHRPRRYFRAGVPESLQRLEGNNILVLFDDSPPVMLEFFGVGRRLLKSLNEPTEREAFIAQDCSWLVPKEDEPKWREWLAAYESPAFLRARSDREIQILETELEAIELRDRAYAILARWNKPLNLVAFMLVLAASGHLLFSAPFQLSALRAIHAWSRPVLPLAFSLGFVFVLSALDLIWTVLLSQAGLMEEVNPLARLFINDPAQLTAFKSVFTFSAIGIFAVLRHFRPAQVGAWWACLICTLLATRWLVFHSLSV